MVVLWWFNGMNWAGGLFCATVCSPTMALSGTASLISVHPNRAQNHQSAAVLSNPTQYPIHHLSFSPCKPTKISYSQLPFTVSAISGSPGIGSSVVGEETTDSLETVEVFDLNGKGIPITDLWKDRKVVVAFARHFGCVLCRKRADYLAAKKEQMDVAGVALVLIGPGSVDQAIAFSQQTNFKGEVYADPNHAAYEALRLISGVSTTFTPKAGLKILQSYMEGYRQDWKLSSEKQTVTRGGWQQGGIIVAGPGKSNISYIHKDKEAGDDPPIEDILKACCT